jgi:adenine C2-methylase RlmN of 23S rRNA A2503 and tRNA A37
MNKVMKSNIDKSVNFVEDQLVGFLESRYVRKVEDYFICYLSSQTGCNRGCKFCHLTATGQTQFKDSDYQDFLNQALQVFRHYRKDDKAKYMHYNFMARGEALANKNLIRNADEILLPLAQLATKDNLNPKFNMSSIMPKTLDKSLTDIFQVVLPTMYYSLYSVDPDFRKKWLPSAMEVGQALDLLKDYQDMSKKIVKIHFAFIKGQNDSEEGLKEMCNEIEKRNLLCEFNLVRYNPYSSIQGEESDEKTIERNLKLLSKHFHGKVQMIPRVGYDVKASCGMFVDKKKE